MKEVEKQTLDLISAAGESLPVPSRERIRGSTYDRSEVREDRSVSIYKTPEGMEIASVRPDPNYLASTIPPGETEDLIEISVAMTPNGLLRSGELSRVAGLLGSDIVGALPQHVEE